MASACTEIMAAPASTNASRYRSGCVIIRCTSSGSRVARCSAVTTGGPMVRFGTKWPSITSTWIRSAPPASTRAMSSREAERSLPPGWTARCGRHRLNSSCDGVAGRDLETGLRRLPERRRRAAGPDRELGADRHAEAAAGAGCRRTRSPSAPMTSGMTYVIAAVAAIDEQGSTLARAILRGGILRRPRCPGRSTPIGSRRAPRPRCRPAPGRSRRSARAARRPTGTAGSSRAVAHAHAHGRVAAQDGAGVRVLREDVVGRDLGIGPARVDLQRRVRHAASARVASATRVTGRSGTLTSRARVATRMRGEEERPERHRRAAMTRNEQPSGASTRECPGAVAAMSGQSARWLSPSAGIGSEKCTTRAPAHQHGRKERVRAMQRAARSPGSPPVEHAAGTWARACRPRRDEVGDARRESRRRRRRSPRARSSTSHTPARPPGPTTLGGAVEHPALRRRQIAREVLRVARPFRDPDRGEGCRGPSRARRTTRSRTRRRMAGAAARRGARGARARPRALEASRRSSATREPAESRRPRAATRRSRQTEVSGAGRASCRRAPRRHRARVRPARRPASIARRAARPRPGPAISRAATAGERRPGRREAGESRRPRTGDGVGDDAFGRRSTQRRASKAAPATARVTVAGAQLLNWHQRSVGVETVAGEPSRHEPARDARA